MKMLFEIHSPGKLISNIINFGFSYYLLVPATLFLISITSLVGSCGVVSFNDSLDFEAFPVVSTIRLVLIAIV